MDCQFFEDFIRKIPIFSHLLRKVLANCGSLMRSFRQFFIFFYIFFLAMIASPWTQHGQSLLYEKKKIKTKDDFGNQLCVYENLPWLCQCKREYHSIKSGQQAIGSFYNVYGWDHQQLTTQLERNVASNWQVLLTHYSDPHIKDYFPVYLFQALFLFESDIFRFFASQVYLILLLGQGLTQK